MICTTEIRMANNNKNIKTSTFNLLIIIPLSKMKIFANYLYATKRDDEIIIKCDIFQFVKSFKLQTFEWRYIVITDIQVFQLAKMIQTFKNKSIYHKAAQLLDQF